MDVVDLNDESLNYSTPSGVDINITRLRSPNIQQHFQYEFPFYLVNEQPLEAKIADQFYFVPERSVIKVIDGKFEFNYREYATLHLFRFNSDPMDYLKSVVSSQRALFKELAERPLNTQVDFLGDLDRLYPHTIIGEHPNVGKQMMFPEQGIYIAPPGSRRKGDYFSGWQMSALDGSPWLGIANNLEWEIRRKREVPHQHLISTEFYIVVYGKLGMDIDGKAHILSSGNAIVIPPGVMHTRTQIYEPCRMIVARTPIMDDIPQYKGSLSIGVK